MIGVSSTGVDGEMLSSHVLVAWMSLPKILIMERCDLTHR